MTTPIEDGILVPITTVEQLAATVNVRDILIRQDRVLRIISYTTTDVPSGYVLATCEIKMGQQEGTTIELMLPITPATANANLVKYFAIGSEWGVGTQVQGADGSRGTVNEQGYIGIWKSGTKFRMNTVVTFREYGSGVTKIGEPPV